VYLKYIRFQPIWQSRKATCAVNADGFSFEGEHCVSRCSTWAQRKSVFPGQEAFAEKEIAKGDQSDVKQVLKKDLDGDYDQQDNG
jgi:hypothetical protein